MSEENKIRDTAAALIEAGVAPPRAIREAARISPDALGQATDISAERLLQIEEGMLATAEELEDIGGALGVPTEHLSKS